MKEGGTVCVVVVAHFNATTHSLHGKSIQGYIHCIYPVVDRVMRVSAGYKPSLVRTTRTHCHHWALAHALAWPSTAIRLPVVLNNLANVRSGQQTISQWLGI